MEKRAILVSGSPGIKDDPKRFERALNRDLSIMEQIAKEKGYSTKVIDHYDVEKETSLPFQGDFLFYYSGHAKNGVFDGGILEI